MPRRVHATTAMMQCMGLQPGNAEESNPHKDVTAWAEPHSGRSLECEPLWRKLPPRRAVDRAHAKLPQHGRGGNCRQLSCGTRHAPVTHSPNPKTEDSVRSGMRAWSCVERGEEKGGLWVKAERCETAASPSGSATRRGRGPRSTRPQAGAGVGHPTSARRGARGGG